MNQDQLIADFERQLEANRQEIVERRQKLIAETGHSMPANRKKYLRKLAVARLRATVAGE